MPGGRPPKYLNTSDGSMFRKSDILYGLDHARRAIARDGAAIVVEGYTDVIMLHQHGIDRAVASMGTALTEGQVTELRPALLDGAAWPSTPTPRAARHRCGAWSSPARRA